MNLLTQIKQKSIQDKIPIVRDNTLGVINHLISNNGYSSILELGTAYGYSAYYFSLNKQVNKITTIEKDKQRYDIAREFLKTNEKIKLINDDVFLYKPKKQYDLIFVDGPKSHQEKLVDKYLQYLNKNGTMVIDNIYLKKFDDLASLTKNQKNLIIKIKKFREWLISQTKFKTKILDVDDGIAIVTI